MRTSPHSLLAAACLHTFALGLGLGLASTPATADEPTARDLIALAPVISSSDEKIRSIEIAGYDRADGQIVRTYRGLYRAPDRFSFILRDGHDGTPLSIAADRKMLVYDPVRPEVLVFPHVSNYQTIKFENGKYETSWGTKFSGREPDQILLDLKSMFTLPSESGAPARVTVTKAGERRYVLTRKIDEYYLRSRVDLDRANPFMTCETAPSPEGPPYRCIDRIIVNGAVDDSEFAFPSLDGLAGTLKVREVKDGLFAMSDAANVLARTYYVRKTLHGPKSHRGVITPLLAGVRWSRVEENDEHYAKLVRDLIPPDPIQRAVDGPGEADDREAVKRTGFDAIRDHLPHLPYKIKYRLKIK